MTTANVTAKPVANLTAKPVANDRPYPALVAAVIAARGILSGPNAAEVGQELDNCLRRARPIPSSAQLRIALTRMRHESANRFDKALAHLIYRCTPEETASLMVVFGEHIWTYIPAETQ